MSFRFGGRAEENVHILYLKKHLDIEKKTNTRSKGKGREKIIFKIIKHKNPGAYYIIKYVFKKKPTNYYTYVYESIKYSALVRNTHIPSLLSLTERDSGVHPAAGLLWPRVSLGAPSPSSPPPPPGTGARRGSPAPYPRRGQCQRTNVPFPFLPHSERPSLSQTPTSPSPALIRSALSKLVVSSPTLSHLTPLFPSLREVRCSRTGPATLTGRFAQARARTQRTHTARHTSPPHPATSPVDCLTHPPRAGRPT